MLLTKVTLENYGVFRDRNEFDFSCTTDKPIILVGGRNGSGKTTLFESIMLCLYGQAFFDKKISRKDYEKFLALRVHRYLGTQVSADSTSVTTEFKFFHQGKVDLYSVSRRWRNDDGKIVEEFSVMVNDKSLDLVEESEWQSFIDGLIPRGISKLFFFDGEKIQKMAEQGSEDIEIRSSFNMLLGLDLVEQLQSDLRIHVLRLAGGKEKEIMEKIDQMIKEKEENQEKIRELREKLAAANVEIESTVKTIGVLEAKVSSLGGNYATKREELKVRKAEIEARLGVVENNIRELCGDLLPFCTIPREITLLKDQLRSDEEVVKQKFEKEILERNNEEIKKSLSSGTMWKGIQLEGSIKEEIISRFSGILEKKAGEERPDKKGVINYSTTESAHILELIDKIAADIPRQLEKETLAYNEMTEELNKIETALANAPRDDEIGPLVSEINSLYERVGSFRKEAEHLEQKISVNNSLVKLVNTKIKNLVDEKQKDQKTSTQVSVAERVQKALDEYAGKLKERKMELLERYLKESLETLMHKTNFISRVSVDKHTFEVSLYRKDGTVIPKDMLSNGEKQMLATSVLWALARTSGKPLPFIIDTPLARLDLEHRENLVERFYPFASHQVAIFSTNSEIDEKYYPMIKPYISRSYLMNYSSEKGKTGSSGGYFWDAKEGLVAL